MTEPKSSTHRVFQDTLDEIRARLLGDSEDAQGKYARLQEAVSELARKEGFEVTHVVGVGGMGAVVKATDMKLRRTVALKFLPPDFLSDEISALELRREAEIASRITHENVVHILSWHEIDRVPFYAMEFIEGQSLDELVRKRKRLSTNEALRIIGEASRGVQALHDMDIIHRDIKPQNILINYDGRVKIADFGISRTREAISFEAYRKRVAGTPDFMAPEQARGDAATRQSDIYGLGATLYYMLTGHVPVEVEGDLSEHMKAVAEGRWTPIKKHLPRLNPKVVRLVNKALSANPSRRHLDIQSFRHEIDDAFLQQTPSSGSAIFDLLRRNKRIVSSIILIVASTFAGYYVGQIKGYERGMMTESRSSLTLRLAQPRIEALRRVLAANPQEADFTKMHNDLQRAVERNDVRQLEFLVPLADRMLLRWEALKLMERAQSDATSPLAPIARSLLIEAQSRDSARSEAALNEWRSAWYYLLETGRLPEPPAPPAEEPPVLSAPPAIMEETQK